MQEGERNVNVQLQLKDRCNPISNVTMVSPDNADML